MLADLRVYMAPSRGEEPAPYDVRDHLSSIAVPTLVLVGRHGPVCSVRWATALRDGIPGSELTIFEHSGHFAHIQELDAFGERIQEWVGHIVVIRGRRHGRVHGARHQRTRGQRDNQDSAVVRCLPHLSIERLLGPIES